MPLPKNYMFSTWVLQSKLPRQKFVPVYEDITSQIIEHKLRVPKSRQDITETTEYAYANFITKTKDVVKSFNYSKVDKLRVDSNIILDLHDESTILEKLDREFDIKDGYTV
jgi:hypothetical protein